MLRFVRCTVSPESSETNPPTFPSPALLSAPGRVFWREGEIDLAPPEMHLHIEIVRAWIIPPIVTSDQLLMPNLIDFYFPYPPS